MIVQDVFYTAPYTKLPVACRLISQHLLSLCLLSYIYIYIYIYILNLHTVTVSELLPLVSAAQSAIWDMHPAGYICQSAQTQE